MKQATLCLLVRENEDEKELLLAMKKRGFGQGRWNGVGGKLAPEKGDKNIVDAALRETEEEIGVKIKDFEKVGLIKFLFSSEQEEDWEMHIFLAKVWEGEPTDSEEMAPKWFKLNEIPFDEMWPDDKFWLPHILEGKKLKAEFVFENFDTILEHDIKIVEELS